MSSFQSSPCIPVVHFIPKSLFNFQSPTPYDISLNQSSYHFIIPIGIKQSQIVESHNTMNGTGLVYNSNPQQFSIENKTNVSSNIEPKIASKPKTEAKRDEEKGTKTIKTPRKKFSPEEDEKLKDLVEKIGSKKWEIIAKEMPGRTGRQCRDRYLNYLVPGFFNGQWSQQEDDLLLRKYMEFGSQWSKITTFFKNRSANSLKNRWNYFVSRHLTDMPMEKIQNFYFYKNTSDHNISSNTQKDDNVEENEMIDAIYENTINYSNPFEFIDNEQMNEGGELIYKDENHEFPFTLID